MPARTRICTSTLCRLLAFFAFLCFLTQFLPARLYIQTFGGLKLSKGDCAWGWCMRSELLFLLWHYLMHYRHCSFVSGGIALSGKTEGLGFKSGWSSDVPLIFLLSLAANCHLVIKAPIVLIPFQTSDSGIWQFCCRVLLLAVKSEVPQNLGLKVRASAGSVDLETPPKLQPCRLWFTTGYSLFFFSSPVLFLWCREWL